MKYLAIVLMPSEKDRKYFKLKILLEASSQSLSERKNKSGHLLYQILESDSLHSAHEAVKILNPPVEMQYVPERQSAVMGTTLTHVILELTDDYDPAKPLRDFVARVFLLQPDCYPHVEICNELDAIENKIRLLQQEVEAGSSDVASLEASLIVTLQKQEQLNARFETLRTQPLEFKGPQFDRVNQARPVAELFVDMQPRMPILVNADNDNNAPAEAAPRQFLVRSSERGFFAAAAPADVADLANDETPSPSVVRHT